MFAEKARPKNKFALTDSSAQRCDDAKIAMLKINKILYVQYNNSSSTKVVNFSDINKRSRLIRDFYDLEIHKRITELGVEDWNWDSEEQKSFDFFFMDRTRYFEREGVCNLTIN